MMVYSMYIRAPYGLGWWRNVHRIFVINTLLYRASASHVYRVFDGDGTQSIIDYYIEGVKQTKED